MYYTIQFESVMIFAYANTQCGQRAINKRGLKKKCYIFIDIPKHAKVHVCPHKLMRQSAQNIIYRDNNMQENSVSVSVCTDGICSCERQESFVNTSFGVPR